MEKHFYIGEGHEADALVAETLKKEESSYAARRALISEYDADGLMLADNWGNSEVSGLAFFERTSRPYLKGETPLREGGYGYHPRLSTKEGKRLAQKIKAEELNFSASHFILNKLCLHRKAIVGRVLCWSVAGVASRKIIVSIPGATKDEQGGDSFPSIPSWLREVKESEWLAIQGR